MGLAPLVISGMGGLFFGICVVSRFASINRGVFVQRDRATPLREVHALQLHRELVRGNESSTTALNSIWCVAMAGG